MNEEENTTQEELDSMIAISMAKYEKKKSDEAQKAQEVQDAMDAKFNTAMEEQEKTWQAERDAKENERLEALSKKYGFKLDDSNTDDTGNDSDTQDEPFNSIPVDEKTMKANKMSKEFSQFYCSKLLKDDGYEMPANSFNAVPYENIIEKYTKFGRDAFIASNSDSDCDDDPSAWENDDCFVDNVWFAVICKSDLLGKVGHRVYAHNMGCGGQVQVKHINIPSPATDWGYPATLSPCECLTCVTNAFATYTVQIKKYGDYRVVCNADEILAGDLQTPIMQTMAIRLAERIDNEIMTNLIAATHVYTADLGASCGDTARTTDCCEWTIDLWDAIMELEADMRAAGYFANSDPTLLIHPDVAVYLKYRNGLSIPPWMIGSIQMDGTTIMKIGNIKVIETCHMNACATDTDDMALLIDPDRAFAEVWAQKPKFTTDHDPIECDSTKLVVFAYGGFDVLDDGAIGAIQNP